MMDKLFTVDEAAHYLRVSKSMVYFLTKTGKLISIRIGYRVLISESDIQQFVVASRTPHYLSDLCANDGLEREEGYAYA